MTKADREGPDAEQLPPGYARNTDEQKEALRSAACAALAGLDGSGVTAVALVFVMPDATVTAAIAGDADNLSAMASLLRAGPEVLRVTVGRLIAGKGDTRIVRGSMAKPR